MFRHLPQFSMQVKLMFSFLWWLGCLLTFDTLTVGNQLLNLHSHSLKENQLVIIECELCKLKDQNVLPSRYLTVFSETDLKPASESGRPLHGILKSWQSSAQCFALCSTRNPLKLSILGNLQVTTPPCLLVRAFLKFLWLYLPTFLIGHFGGLGVHLSNRLKVELTCLLAHLQSITKSAACHFLGLVPQDGTNGHSVILQDYKYLDISHHLAWGSKSILVLYDGFAVTNL